jgi:parvulin-like peptidyl-prolyl isomerase
MDEPHSIPVSLRCGKLALAVALAFFAGCKNPQTAATTKLKNPEAIEPESQGRVKLAGDKSSTDAPAVGLDGSAAADGAPATPNAPGIVAKSATTAGAANWQSAGSGLVDDDVDTTREKSRMTETNAGPTNDNTQIATSEPPASANSDTSGTASAKSSGAKPKREASKVVAASATGAVGGGVTNADADEPANKAFAPLSGNSLTNLPSSINVEGDGVRIDEGTVVATVNGEPIFLNDVLRDLPPQVILDAQKQLPPEDFRAWRRKLVAAQLQRPIEEILLLQSLRTKLKPEQLKEISKRIDESFDKDALPKVMQQENFHTVAEFDKALLAKGSSIDVLRTKNRNRELAQQYIMTRVAPKAHFDRPELLKYYNEHKEDYAIPALSKWEQIQLKFNKNGGPEATRKKADEIVKRLASGESFAEIARKCSNGPNASNGGTRGWTKRDILANEALNQALVNQPLGIVGPPMESEGTIDIIRVVGRQEKDYKPFAGVQEDIKANLRNEEWAKASKALFEDLEGKAEIKKDFDY